MLNTENCQKIAMILETNWGTVDITPEEWITEGPGLRYGRKPGPIYCFDEEPPRLIGRVPLMYRNNSFTQFLIAMGVFEYPWGYSPDEMKEIPTQLVLLAEDQERIPNNGSQTAVFFIDWPQFKTKIPFALTSWSIKTCKIFDFLHYMTTNDASLFGYTTNVADRLKALHSPDAFVMSVNPIIPYAADPDDISNYMADLTPDEIFAGKVTRGQKKIEEFNIHFVIGDVSKYELSVLAFTLFLPKDPIFEVRPAINFFALTKLGEANRLVIQLNEMMEQNLSINE